MSKKKAVPDLALGTAVAAKIAQQTTATEGTKKAGKETKKVGKEAGTAVKDDVTLDTASAV